MVEHALVPALEIVAMVIGFVSALGGVTMPILDIEIPPLSAPFSYAPLIVAVWVVAGVALFFMLRTRDPQATSQIGAAVAEA